MLNGNYTEQGCVMEFLCFKEDDSVLGVNIFDDI